MHALCRRCIYVYIQICYIQEVYINIYIYVLHIGGVYVYITYIYIYYVCICTYMLHIRGVYMYIFIGGVYVYIYISVTRRTTHPRARACGTSTWPSPRVATIHTCTLIGLPHMLPYEMCIACPCQYAMPL